MVRGYARAERRRCFMAGEKLSTKEKYRIPRQHQKEIPEEERRQSFAEIRQGITAEQAQLEACRCIACKSQPCMQACGLHNNIPSIIEALARGDFEEAAFKNSFPFSAICGRVCYHPCEQVCPIGKKGEPVAICTLERFAADYMNEKHTAEEQAALAKEKNGFPVSITEYLPPVAVVGSGPAGLMCAYDLVRLGYPVTVFERGPVFGGMLTLGIPEYRLPREIFIRTLEILQNMGVRFIPNVVIGQYLSLNELKGMGYAAMFLAFGAHQGKKMNIPGEELEGVLDAVTFLREVNLGQKIKPGNKVAVIGGGNSAMDAVRTALRLGCEKAMIVYRRTRQEMPAGNEEIEDAIKEGVEFHYLMAPVKINGKDGKVVSMICQKMQLGEPDSSGRRSPVPIPGSEFEMDVDVIFPAVSQEPEMEGLKLDAVSITKWKTVDVNSETLETSVPWIFAGGDAVTGPKTVNEALAAGRKAAQSIHRFLSS